LELISTAINTILLAVVYFAGVGTTSMIMKAAGKKIPASGTISSRSYWTDISQTGAQAKIRANLCKSQVNPW
jgi:hypothetical protein